MELRFPLFIDLRGKKAVVIGGGAIGLRRAEVLARFGAAVTVVSPALHHSVEGIVHIPRPYRPGDLEGALLAVAATDNRSVNQAVTEEARSRGVPISVADRQEDCDFFFPAICEGPGLVAGVAGDGREHRKTAEAARRIRQVLEELV